MRVGGGWVSRPSSRNLRGMRLHARVLAAVVLIGVPLACGGSDRAEAQNTGVGGSAGSGLGDGSVSGGTAGASGSAASAGVAGAGGISGTSGAGGAAASAGSAGSSGSAGAAGESDGGGCSPATCTGDGQACVMGVCTDDCRPSSANPCGSGSACDFTDGTCRDATSECFMDGPFVPCPTASSPNQACGPGTMCGAGIGCSPALHGCTGFTCDPGGRCWGTGCPCDRPAGSCAPAALTELNRAEFVGSLVNMQNSEGAFALDFDDLCNAYAVTMISGPDYLRQLAPDGTLTTWTSTTNLNMGEVAVRETFVDDTLQVGDIAATYICCASCGCVETGLDGRLGVVRLDRTSASRPLPNVLPSAQTSGAGPFGNPSVDTGPYGLTWDGAQNALYVGNSQANGELSRVNLAAATSAVVATFPGRITAARAFDVGSLILAVEGGVIYRYDVVAQTFAVWATVAAHATSLRRDLFTGDVFAEIATTPPQIVRISEDGAAVTTFQTAPYLGRIAIAPDGYLYHVSVWPNVLWNGGTSIVRWALPAKR